MKLEDLIEDRVLAENTYTRRSIDASCCGTKRDWDALHLAGKDLEAAQTALSEHLAKLAGLRALIDKFVIQYSNLTAWGALGREDTRKAQEALNDARTAMNAVLEILE